MSTRRLSRPKNVIYTIIAILCVAGAIQNQNINDQNNFNLGQPSSTVAAAVR